MRTNNFEDAFVWMAQGKRVYNSLWVEKVKHNPKGLVCIWGNENMTSFSGISGDGVTSSSVYLSPSEMIYGEWNIYLGEDSIEGILKNIHITLLKSLPLSENRDIAIKDLDKIGIYLSTHNIKTREDLKK